MNRIRRMVSVGCLSALASCGAMIHGTAAQMGKVRVGMSREAVVAELGEPSTVEASAAREEVLIYRWMPQVIAWGPELYFVRLVDGRVHSYGKKT